MEQDSRTRLRALQVDGGAVKNNLLMQIQADLSGLPVARPKNIETTALGAGQLAGLSCGFWSQKDLARMRQADRTFRPRWKPARRAEALAGWKKAVDMLIG